MRSSAVVMALATGMLPAGVLGAAINLDICSLGSVLEYFTCTTRVNEDCVENLAEQATAWCSSYLSIAPVTVYATTVTPVSTETVTETTTAATTTSTEIDITTVEVSETAPVTSVVESIVTETITLPGGAVTMRKRTLTFIPPTASATDSTTDSTTASATDSTTASVTDSTTSSATASASASATVSVTATATATASNTVNVQPGCIDLSHKNLLRHPASRLSRACSCLSPEPTTITLDATTLAASTETATEFSTVTDVEPETTLLTELVTTVAATQDVTVTETSTATTTVSPPDPCSMGYGSTYTATTLEVGLHFIPHIESAYACCQSCLGEVSCAYAVAPNGGGCYFALELTGSRISDMCPGGLASVDNLTMYPIPGGIIFKGPCWSG